MEGNLPVSSKCAVCDKTCGSVLRYLFVIINYFRNIYYVIKIKMLTIINQLKLGFKTGDVYGAEQQYTLHAALNIQLNVHWGPID